MAYRLTQEDIDRLGLVDAVPDDIATDEELMLLFPSETSIQDQQSRSGTLEVPTPSVAGPQSAATPDAYVTPYSALRDLGLDVGSTNQVLEAIGSPEAPSASPTSVDQSDTSQYQPTFSEQDLTGAFDLTKLIGAQPAATQQDQFSNLTKTQRRILAAQYIRDAGAQLQGLPSNYAMSFMTDLTERADQARKAEAAQQRNAMMSQLMGGGLTGEMDLSMYDPNAARQQVITALTAGLIDGPTAKILLDQVVEKEGRLSSASKSRSLIADIDLLSSSAGLDQILGVKGIGTSALEALNLGALLPEAQEARAILEKIKGGIFLNAFESLKGGGQITELEGIKAEQAEARLKTTQDPEAFREALAELRFYADIAARRSMGERIPPDTIYERKVQDKTPPPAEPSAAGDDLEQFYGGGSN